MLTSRIKQAISSVQLFVQRAFLNLEDGVELTATTSEQWEWMKNYRVWEAARKVFLYPENWIEPELRLDKSPLFEQLENALQQGELDDAAAEKAYTQLPRGAAEDRADGGHGPLPPVRRRRRRDRRPAARGGAHHVAAARVLLPAVDRPSRVDAVGEDRRRHRRRPRHPRRPRPAAVPVLADGRAEGGADAGATRTIRRPDRLLRDEAGLDRADERAVGRRGSSRPTLLTVDGRGTDGRPGRGPAVLRGVRLLPARRHDGRASPSSAGSASARHPGRRSCSARSSLDSRHRRRWSRSRQSRGRRSIAPADAVVERMRFAAIGRIVLGPRPLPSPIVVGTASMTRTVDECRPADSVRPRTSSARRRRPRSAYAYPHQYGEFASQHGVFLDDDERTFHVMPEPAIDWDRFSAEDGVDPIDVGTTDAGSDVLVQPRRTRRSSRSSSGTRPRSRPHRGEGPDPAGPDQRPAAGPARRGRCDRAGRRRPDGDGGRGPFDGRPAAEPDATCRRRAGPGRVHPPRRPTGTASRSSTTRTPATS